MKTQLTQQAIDAVVHLGHIPEKAWWGTDGDGNGKDHLFVTLKRDGHPSDFTRAIAKDAIKEATNMAYDHIHVT